MSDLLKAFRDRDERQRAEVVLSLLTRHLDGAPQLGPHGDSLLIEATLLDRLMSAELSPWGGGEIRIALDPVVPHWLRVYLYGAARGEQPARKLADDYEEQRHFLSPHVWVSGDLDLHHAKELYARLPASMHDEIDRHLGPTDESAQIGRRLTVSLPVAEPVPHGGDLLAHQLRFACRLAAAVEAAWRDA